MEIKNMKKQSEMKNTITEMKNILQGMNTRVYEAEDEISDLEGREGSIKHPNSPGWCGSVD